MADLSDMVDSSLKRGCPVEPGPRIRPLGITLLARCRLPDAGSAGRPNGAALHADRKVTLRPARLRYRARDSCRSRTFLRRPLAGSSGSRVSRSESELGPKVRLKERRVHDTESLDAPVVVMRLRLLAQTGSTLDRLPRVATKSAAELIYQLGEARRSRGWLRPLQRDRPAPRLVSRG